ncbi:MAG: hypothetical protein FWC48_03075 [Actinomycetia bacterium]|nr:hypothetical protein [Actinomycetes bacterium]
MLNRPKLRFFTGLVLCCLLGLMMVPAVYGADAPAPAGTIDATALAQVPTVTKDGITNLMGMEIAIVTNTEKAQKFMLVNGTLPDTASLPAKVQVALPKGAQVAYIGELSGTADTAGDVPIQIPAPVARGDQDIYTVTLTKYKTVRFEFPTTDPFQSSTTSTGTAVQVAKLSYKPLTDLMFLYLGAEVPTNALVMKSDPAFENAGTLQDGTSLYSAAFSQVKAGKTYEATLTYQKGGGVTKDPTSPLVIVAIVALVVALAALLFMVLRKRFSAEEA